MTKIKKKIMIWIWEDGRKSERESDRDLKGIWIYYIALAVEYRYMLYYRRIRLPDFYGLMSLDARSEQDVCIAPG